MNSDCLNEYLDQKAIFTGTQVAYYIVCPTKLWLFSHFTTMEQTSEIVKLGQLLQQTSFPYVRKEMMIDQKIAVDFIKKGEDLIVHEIKKSNKLEKAHAAQLLYYLYYLKHEKSIKNVKGIINYPSLRKIVKIELTPEKEAELCAWLKGIEQIISLPQPPKPEKKRYCRKCSYFEFCWI